MDIKEILREHIGKEYGKSATRHHSYCKYPEEDCSCRQLTEITDDQSLIQGGYIDSFSMGITVIFIEKTFNIKIRDIDIDPANFDSINRMAKLIEKYEDSSIR